MDSSPNKPLRTLRIFLGLCSFFLTALPATGLLAAEIWRDYRSDSGIFKSRMLEGFATTSTTFMADEEQFLNSEESSILIDQRPYKNVMKSYIIKFDQTLGPGLARNEIETFLNQEFENYFKYYRNLNGVVRYQTKEVFDDYIKGELQISYYDPAFGPQSIRAHIFFNSSTRLHQIVIGPEETINSYQARDFFESLSLNPGTETTDKDFIDDWKSMESPTGIFSVVYPKKIAPPYYTDLPVAQWDDKGEKVSMSFHDPVRNEKIFFTVYGYKFNSEVTFTGQHEVLLKRHIMKYRNSANGIKFSKGMDNIRNKPYMEARFLIRPPEGYPYIHSVKIKSYFAGNYMIVQEVLTSEPLHASLLIKNLSNYLEFTPEKSHEARQPDIYSTPVENLEKKIFRDGSIPTTQIPTVPGTEPNQQQDMPALPEAPDAIAPPDSTTNP